MSTDNTTPKRPIRTGKGLFKITDEDVREIRRLRGTVSQKDLAARFGIHRSSVANIQRGRKRVSAGGPIDTTDHRRRITEADVLAIREDYPNETNGEVAKRYGLSVSGVSKIRTGETWIQAPGKVTYGLGTQTRGEDQPTSKLTTEQVLAIRRFRFKKTYREVAEMFGVSGSCIAAIQNRRTWKHLPEEPRQ
jgi:DNA-binding CsgD family transcriptional regulator